MSEVTHKPLVRWPLILVCCVMVFLVWPILGYAYALASFEIEGDAAGEIAPGVQVPIELRFVNRHPESMTISRLQVSVQKLDAPAADPGHPCSFDDFELTQVASSARWTLPPNTTVGLPQLGVPRSDWPKITMRNRAVNQDGCKGAKLILNYSAHGILGD